ncbi:MAG: hypothetical protein ACI9OJ_001373, partial [Myxococcota bacterium]
MTVVLIGVLLPIVSMAKPRTRVIRVMSTPPGAKVFLDSATEPLGTTPIKRVRVPVGQHTFRFVKDGYEDASVQFTVKRHWQRVKATLQQAATLKVRKGATPASISVDGLDRGQAPLRLQLRPGRHQVVITAPGVQPLTSWVTLERGRVVVI